MGKPRVVELAIIVTCIALYAGATRQREAESSEITISGYALGDPLPAPPSRHGFIDYSADADRRTGLINRLCGTTLQCQGRTFRAGQPANVLTPVFGKPEQTEGHLEFRKHQLMVSLSEARTVLSFQLGEPRPVSPF